MQCPKCGHTQSGGEECSACGIIFKKFAQVQAKRRAEALSPAEKTTGETPPPPKNQLPKVVLPCVILVVMFVALYYMFRSDEPSDPKSIPALAEPTVDKQTPADRDGGGLAEQLASAVPTRNPVEKARNATVFIKSGIGIGSGFFINRTCDILTNRHVVIIRDEEKEQLTLEKEHLGKLIQDLTAHIQATIENLKYRGVKIDENNPPPPLRAQMDVLRKAQVRYDEIEQYLQGAEGLNGDIEISLVDGSTYDAMLVDSSEDYDLALLRIENSNCPCLQSGSVEQVQFGQKVFTIGNPSGLRHTVTAGILSGYREEGKYKLIQTDAPINPGNSGGPLIDESGRVIGINTMVLRDTEGIGFAIPIETAFEVFADYLRM